MSDRGFVLFSSRYGISTSKRPDLEHFAQRHALDHHHARDHDNCTFDLRFRCQCSGNTPRGQFRPSCCARMTGEDMRCDECREWCYAVDEAHTKYPFPLVSASVLGLAVYDQKEQQ